MPHYYTNFEFIKTLTNLVFHIIHSSHIHMFPPISCYCLFWTDYSLSELHLQLKLQLSSSVTIMFLWVNGGDTYMIRFKLSLRRLHIYKVLHECTRSGQGYKILKMPKFISFFKKCAKACLIVDFLPKYYFLKMLEEFLKRIDINVSLVNV